jgi:endonuclease/exonuclease/phosphatase family metal-dependent hydrolase
MIKIISFNACILPAFMTNAGSNDDKKKERINLFFKNIGKNYDIILLQEIWDSLWSFKCNNYINYIKNICEKYGFIHLSYNNRKFYQFCNNGLMILSKYPIVNISHHTFKNSGGLQYFVPNGILKSSIFINNKMIDFFITHIHAPPLDSSICNNINKSKNIQKNQIIELIEFIKSHTTSPYYILAGDFNSDALKLCSVSNYMLDYKILTKLLQKLSPLNNDSLLKLKNYPNTYPIPVEGSFLVNNNFIENETCIDHIFTNLEEKNIIDINSLELKIDNLYLSDHSAIELIIDI